MTTKRKPRKKKNQGSLRQILVFMLGVLYVTVFIIALVSIKNRCHITVLELADLQSQKAELENLVSMAEADVQHLSRPDRIKQIAASRFGYVDPVPETLMVVLEPQP